MNSTVYVKRRKTRRGHTWHIQWICPHEKRWKSRKVGTDRKRADYEAAKLQAELDDGGVCYF